MYNIVEKKQNNKSLYTVVLFPYSSETSTLNELLFGIIL